MNDVIPIKTSPAKFKYLNIRKFERSKSETAGSFTSYMSYFLGFPISVHPHMSYYDNSNY